jgi:hypothetical protein
VLKNKIWANFQRIIELFTQKIVKKLFKIWSRDPGSGKKPIPDPGSRGQKGTGSRIRIRNTGKNIIFFAMVESLDLDPFPGDPIEVICSIRIRIEADADPKHWLL